MGVLQKMAKNMSKHELEAEKNIVALEDALEVVQDTLHAFEEVAKQAKFQGRSSSLLMCKVR